MAHFSDEIVGWLGTGLSAYFAAKAKQAADRGPSAGEAVGGVLKQRLPQMFGFNRADEQMFESVRQLVPMDKRWYLDVLIDEMRDYEADIFRLTVAGMPCGNKLVDKPVKNPSKGGPAMTKESISLEFTDEDLRVKYLVDIADEVSRSSGVLLINSDDVRNQARGVVKAMRARRLITRNPAAKKAYETWLAAVKWTKKNLCQFFEVDNLDEITEDMIARRIGGLATAIPQKKNRGQGFWSWLFERGDVCFFRFRGFKRFGAIVIFLAFVLAMSLAAWQ